MDVDIIVCSRKMELLTNWTEACSQLSDSASKMHVANASTSFSRAVYWKMLVFEVP